MDENTEMSCKQTNTASLGTKDSCHSSSLSDFTWVSVNQETLSTTGTGKQFSDSASQWRLKRHRYRVQSHLFLSHETEKVIRPTCRPMNFPLDIPRIAPTNHRATELIQWINISPSTLAAFSMFLASFSVVYTTSPPMLLLLVRFFLRLFSPFSWNSTNSVSLFLSGGSGASTPVSDRTLGSWLRHKTPSFPGKLGHLIGWNISMTAEKLASTCVGWKNGDKLSSTCMKIWTRLNTMQVDASRWPNGMQVCASFKTCTDLHRLAFPFGQGFKLA